MCVCYGMYTCIYNVHILICIKDILPICMYTLFGLMSLVDIEGVCLQGLSRQGRTLSTDGAW